MARPVIATPPLVLIVALLASGPAAARAADGSLTATARETDQIMASAHLIYRIGADAPPVEGSVMADGDWPS